MHAIRYENKSTTQNAGALIELLKDPKCTEVRLYSTASTPTPEYSQNDGNENNLPLLVATAKYEIPSVGPIYILFDGLFLTAARRPRYLEVRDVLDVVTEVGRTTFCTVPVPFTSELPPHQAVETLLAAGHVEPLTDATRKAFFALLSMIPEESYP